MMEKQIVLSAVRAWKGIRDLAQQSGITAPSARRVYLDVTRVLIEMVFGLDEKTRPELITTCENKTFIRLFPGDQKSNSVGLEMRTPAHLRHLASDALAAANLLDLIAGGEE